jgi:hypothetical protein
LDDPNPASLVTLLVLAAVGAAVYLYGFRSLRRSDSPQPSSESVEDSDRPKRNSLVLGLLLLIQMAGVAATFLVLNPGPTATVLIVLGWALLFYVVVRLVWSRN